MDNSKNVKFENRFDAPWIQDGKDTLVDNAVVKYNSLETELLNLGSEEFRLREIDELFETEHKRWMIKNFIGYGDKCMIFGLPGCGKSFLAIDLALTLITNAPKFAGYFDNESGKQLNVLYMFAEGHSGIAQRIKAAVKHYGVTANDIKPYFKWIPTVVTAFTTEKVSEFIAVVKASGWNPDLIIVDTTTDALAGFNENLAGDVSLFYMEYSRLQEALGNSALLLVHHSAKSGEDARGSIVHNSKCDELYRVVKPGGKPGTIEYHKDKDGEFFEPVVFDLVTYEESCYVYYPGTEVKQLSEVQKAYNAIMRVLSDKPTIVFKASTLLTDVNAILNKALKAQTLRKYAKYLVENGNVKEFMVGKTEHAGYSYQFAKPYTFTDENKLLSMADE